MAKKPFIDPLTGLDKDPSYSKKLPSQEALFVSSSLTTGGPQDVGDYFPTESKYDKYITRSDLQNIERERALMQPLGAKAFNAVAGGIASGVLTAAEDIGYLLDFDNNIKRLQGLETVDTNVFSQAFKEAKEKLAEAAPIHRESDQVFDWADPGFYFSSLKGILDSAVGFAIPGMAVSKGIGALQRGARLGVDAIRGTRGVQRSARLDKYLSMIGANPQVQQMVNAGASGYITNFAEGKMMAVEQFENSMAQMEEGLFDENFQQVQAENPEASHEEVHKEASTRTANQMANGKEKEFKTIAGEKADQFINRNKMFAVTDAIGLHGIYKGKGFTRQLLSEKGLKAGAKRLTTLSSDNLILQGAKEGLEEIGQNIFQMEGEYQSMKDAGLNVDDTPDELAARVYKFATSDQALLEGLMGVFGGGPQRIFTEAVSGNLSLSSKKQYKQRYLEQQEQIAANTDFVNKKLAWYSQAQGLKAQSYATGQDNLAEIINKSQFLHVVRDNFVKGTTENIERQLRDAAETTPEQAKANGWDPEYKQQAEKQLEELARMEKQYNRFSRYENQAAVFFNRENRRILEEDHELLRQARDEIETTLELQETPDPDLQAVLKTYDKTLDKLTDNISELDMEYKHLTSIKTQQDEKKKKKDQRDQVQKIQKDLKAKVKKDAEQEKANKRKEKTEAKEKKTEKEEKAEEPTVDATDDTRDPFFDSEEEEGKGAEDIAADQLEEEKKQTEITGRYNDLTTGLTQAETDKDALLEELVHLTSDVKGRENITLEDIVDEMIDRVGTFATEAAFDALEEAYKKIDPDYEITGDFKKFIEPSHAEKNESEAQKSHAKTDTKEQYTDQTEENVTKTDDDIENQIQGKDKETDPTEEVSHTEYSRIKSGAGVLAYLSRVYKRVRGTIEETSNELNSDMLVKDVLDPTKYGKGTKVTIRLEDVNSTPAYAEGAERKEVKWGDKKLAWEVDPDMTQEERDAKYLEQVPIAVYADEEKIGYLHETEWINGSNVSGDVAQDKARNRKIREFIIKNGELNTTIKSKSNGYLFRTTEGTVKTATAMPENLPIVIGSKGDYKTSRTDTRATEKLLNKGEPQEGVTYIIVPVGIDSEIAIPLHVNKASEHEEVVNSIMTALDIFFYEKTDDKSNAIIDGILKETDINITTSNGITDFLELYLNNYDIGQADDLKTYLRDNTSVEQTNNVFMSMRRRENDMNIQVSRGKGVGRKFMSKKWLAQKSEAQQAERFAVVREMISNMYLHTSLDHVDKTVVTIDAEGKVSAIPYNDHIKNITKTPFLSHNIGTEENPNYVYTIQPTIEMDFSEVEQGAIETEDDITIEEKGGKWVVTQQGDTVVTQEFDTEEQARKFVEDIAVITGGKITYEERRAKTDEKKKKIAEEKDDDYEDFDDGMSPTDTDFEAGISAILDEEQVTKIEEESDIMVENGQVIKGIVIADLGAAKQRQLVDYMRSKVIESLLTDEKSLSSKIYGDIRDYFQSNYDKAERNLKKAEEKGDAAAVARFTRAKDEFNLILDNFGKLTALTNDQVSRIDNVQVTEIGTDEETREEQEVGREKWNDMSVFTMTPINGLANEIKWFLSGVRKYTVDNNGVIQPAKNYLGLEEIMSFQELYNTLQRITPNLKPDYNEIITVLKDIANDPEKSKTFPFMKELVEKLEAASQQVKNQFVSGMTNHNVDMRFIMFSENPKTGVYELVEQQSNANAMSEVVQRDWYVNLITNTAQQDGGDSSDYILPEETRNRLWETYEKWKNSKTYPEAEMRQWLQELGIVVSAQTWADIVQGNIKRSGKYVTFADQVQHKDGLFAVLAKNVNSRGDASLVSGNRIVEEGVVKNLARHESLYALYSHSNSHRTGNKTVYSYSQNKFLINRVRELKEFDDGSNPLLDQLSQLSFNGTSQWVTLLQENGGDNAFQKNFDRWIFSLEPLKKRGSKSRDNAELGKLSEGEIEVAKIGMLQAAFADNAGERNRVIKILYPTTSDKTAVMGLRVIARDLAMTREGELEDESIDTLYDAIVLPEIRRIRSFQSKKEKGQTPDVQSYNKGAEQFLFLPEINNVPGVFINGDLNPNIGNLEITTAIKEKIREYVDNLVAEKLADWTVQGIGGENQEFLNGEFMAGNLAKDHNPLRKVDEKNRIKGAATDMVFQYLIGNAEIAMTMTGDPALYYKQAKKNRGKAKTNAEYDFVADAEETYINIGKRLAADIAPGYELADATNNRYVQGLVADPSSSSESKFQITKLLDGQEAYDKVKATKNEEELLAAVKGLQSAPYYAFDSADAQEYTTWKEHLYVMKQAGELSDEEYNEAHFALSNNKDVDKKILGKVMQPMKPVYADNKIDEKDDVEKRIYIKSSAFPLLPQLTRGTDLENLRIAMENQGVDRIAFGTAVKVGNVSNPVSIFNADGKIKKADEISFTGSTMQLSRKGFRIQQRIPYEPKKSEINKVTQASKNLFINMLGVEGFEFEGKTMNGADFQKRYHEIYGELHSLQKEELHKELEYNKENESINKDALRNVLLTEAKERGYPLSDQELIQLDEELKFLAFSGSSNKYEALLNSIVTNRVIKLKMPGKSFVLGSEEGFKQLTTKETDKKIATSGIVFTKNWTGKLLPAREVGGVRYAAQAIVPWKFRGQGGNVIDMNKYVVKKDGVLQIDSSKVPTEVLQLFGMRIPNQGPNSQSWIEIVGFLPEASGDLLIATKDYVVQMGSDFDVDKLYTYQYNTYEHKDNGGIAIHRSERVDKKAALQNKIVDIHIAIHKNPAPEVQKQIATPLGFWELDTLSTEVVDLRKEREAGDRKFTGLSDLYQRTKFKNATAGKAGVGVFSLDSMFNAVAQGKDMVLMQRDDENKLVPVEITFGKKTSDGKLSEELALDGKTYKSDIIAGYQSAAVDNEKEQILDKLNINNHTFKAIKVLNQLGFGEEVALFISQDIIVDYVKELDRLGSSLSPYVPNKEQVAMDNVLAMDKYQTIGGEFDRELAHEKATPTKMRAYIKKGALEPNYVQAQREFLAKFVYLDELGKDIQTLQSTINPDSAGLGKSVMESQLKEEQVYKLTNSPVVNAKALVGDIKVVKKVDEAQAIEDGYVLRKFKQKTYAVKPETINGHAIVYGLFTNNDLWSALFPYKAPGINALLEKVEDTVAGQDDVQIAAKAERRLQVWKEMKSYIYADEELGLHNSTITKERQRILYDEWAEGQNTKESLATVIRKLKETNFGKNHPFISRLEGKPEKNGNPSIVVFNASTAENPDETAIYASFIDMLQQKDSEGNSPVVTTFNNEGYTMRELAQDLILYSYITGGVQEAVQFVKYVPAAYLSTLPFMQKLSSDNHLTADFEISVLEDPVAEYYNVPPFVEQYIQHHTEKVIEVEFSDVTEKNAQNVKGLTTFVLKQEKVDKIGKNIDFVRRPPAYLTMKGEGINSNSRVKLFRHDFKTGKYVQIDTLGSFAASEYNRNTPYQVSQIERNKTTIPKEEVPKGPTSTQSPVTKTPAAPVKESDGRDRLILDLTEAKHKDEVYKDGTEKLKSVLNEVINYGDNKYYASLAQEIFDNINIIPEEFSIVVETAPANEHLGAKMDYRNHTLTIYKNMFIGDMFTADRITSTFLHEVLHTMTGYKIRLYQYENDTSPDGQTTLNSFVAETGITLSDRERKIIKSLGVLMNQAKQKIIGENKEEYEQYRAKIAANQKITPKELSMFYGFEDIGEFVSQALSDVEFQKMLNNIEAPSKKTFWQSIKERMVKLLRAMNFDVKEGSILEHTVSDVLDLVSEGENTYRGITVEEGDFQTATGEPGAAAYDRKNNVIKINRNSLSEKYEQKAWTTPREQKDGTFATALKEDTFSSIDEWINFVMEHEYQHSQIKKQEIESIGFYEDRINEAALKNIYLSNRDGGLKDSNFRAVVTDEEVEEQIKRCK